jgi:hypothetical protein
MQDPVNGNNGVDPAKQAELDALAARFEAKEDTSARGDASGAFVDGDINMSTQVNTYNTPAEKTSGLQALRYNADGIIEMSDVQEILLSLSKEEAVGDKLEIFILNLDFSVEINNVIVTLGTYLYDQDAYAYLRGFSFDFSPYFYDEEAHCDTIYSVASQLGDGTQTDFIPQAGANGEYYDAEEFIVTLNGVVEGAMDKDSIFYSYPVGDEPLVGSVVAFVGHGCDLKAKEGKLKEANAEGSKSCQAQKEAAEDFKATMEAEKTQAEADKAEATAANAKAQNDSKVAQDDYKKAKEGLEVAGAQNDVAGMEKAHEDAKKALAGKKEADIIVKMTQTQIDGLTADIKKMEDAIAKITEAIAQWSEFCATGKTNIEDAIVAVRTKIDEYTAKLSDLGGDKS